jgi:protein-L-isoaspartate O-methyltransferase
MEHLKDTFKHKGRRRQLIEELATMGIHDTKILDAFNAIPRHFFLDLAFDEQAYTNMAFQKVRVKRFHILLRLLSRHNYWSLKKV